MLQTIVLRWWAFLVRGFAALIFGALALLWPEKVLEVFVILFGVFALVDGLFAGLTGFSIRRYSKSWWVLLIEGFLGIIVGLITILWPGMTAVFLYIFLAVWAVFTGILELVQAVHLRRKLRNEWMLVVGGILSIILGIFLILRPVAGVFVVIWMIAVYSILFGFLMIFLGLKMRRYKGNIEIEIKSE
ncbi:MAG: HdeD family acid-resistance protein [Candidatus Krumholzibacteriota bacterium]|nr:HdeD family acid-resistance protein [Candidatus Krumholzibacteriota bacterium]